MKELPTQKSRRSPRKSPFSADRRRPQKDGSVLYRVSPLSSVQATKSIPATGKASGITNMAMIHLMSSYCGGHADTSMYTNIFQVCMYALHDIKLHYIAAKYIHTNALQVCIYTQYNTIQYKAIQCNAIEHNTTHHNTTQHNTTHLIALHCITLHCIALHCITCIQSLITCPLSLFLGQYPGVCWSLIPVLTSLDTHRLQTNVN